MTKESPFSAAAYSPVFIPLCGTWHGFCATPELRTGRCLRAWRVGGQDGLLHKRLTSFVVCQWRRTGGRVIPHTERSS